MGLGLFDLPELIASVELSDLERSLREDFRPDARAISIILPMDAASE